MPDCVAMAIDHEERRRRIAAIAIEVIANEGLGAATIRRIAAEARFSTAAVTHYFVSKQDLLFWTFDVLSTEGDERFDDALRESPEDIVAPLLTLTAWCPTNVRRWKAYLAFWDAAARDQRLAAVIVRSTTAGVAYIERLLATRISDPAARARASRLLNSIIQGISMQAIVSPQDWPEEAVRTTLLEGIEASIASALKPPR